MTDNRWQRAKELFHDALERDPDDRAAFLQTACGDDQALRAEVEGMLAADGGGNFLRTPTARDEFAIPDGRADERRVGSLVGAYRLERVIGAGGMGSVFAASRADGQYEKTVAVKLIKRGFESDDALRRFLRERQLLANLDHPNIARLLDGGVTDDGQPYLVMEYVEGVPITEYADNQKLPTSQRLLLFRQVCAGVQYIHQNLIVHRDLKPANILVAADGVPKLLDFGIAKLLDDAPAAGAGAMTVTGMQVMTPEHASPEQVSGQAISTATDIYSLGIILYELLTGHRPYRFDSNRPQDIERVICEAELQKPSTAIRRVVEVRSSDGSSVVRLTPEIVSSMRDGEPQRLRRRLSGDLDNIVLMALRKEPQRRYESAQQFAEDIRRHQVGLPVIARADTMGYRASKFIRRHSLGVLATAVVLLSLVGGVAVAGWQARVAARQRDAAESAHEQTKEVSAFIEAMLSSVDPANTRGRDVTLREMLDAAASRVAVELRDQPEVEAAVRMVIGTTYQKLGLYAEARTHLERALELRRASVGNTHIDTLISMNSLAALLLDQGHLAEAEPLMQEVLALHRRQLGDNHIETIIATNNYATLLKDLGRLAEAEPLQREAYERMRARLGPAHSDTLAAGCNLGTLLLALGRPDEAEPLMREIVTNCAGDGGADHPVTLYANTILATALGKLGRTADAEHILRETIEHQRRVLGPTHPNTLASINNLASLLQGQGDLVAAQALIKEALASVDGVLDERHPFRLAMQCNLASILLELGRPAEAAPIFAESLATHAEVLGAEHFGTLIVQTGLGKCLTALERFEEAETHLTAAYEALRVTLGDQHERTNNAREALIELYEAWGKPEQAEEYRGKSEIAPATSDPSAP